MHSNPLALNFFFFEFEKTSSIMPPTKFQKHHMRTHNRTPRMNNACMFFPYGDIAGKKANEMFCRFMEILHTIVNGLNACCWNHNSYCQLVSLPRFDIILYTKWNSMWCAELHELLYSLSSIALADLSSLHQLTGEKLLYYTNNTRKHLLSQYA